MFSGWKLQINGVYSGFTRVLVMFLHLANTNPSEQFFKSLDEEIGKCSDALREVAGLRVNGISGELWDWISIELGCELRIQSMILV